MNEQFLRYISSDVKRYYMQVLNGKRLDMNKVVYVFDEVGGGKTVSAIMAIANQIYKKKNSKILILTPYNVCRQFKDEIESKLNKDKINEDNCNVKILEFYEDKNLLKNKELSIEDAWIVISNPHPTRTEVLKGIKFDLMVMDEAQDIVCDNKKQSEKWDKKDVRNIYLQQYIELCVKKNVPNTFLKLCGNLNGCKSCSEIQGKTCEKQSGANKALQKVTIKELHLLINIVSLWHLESGNAFSVKTGIRMENITFQNCTKLHSEKLMYLSATPFKYKKEIDFCNYTLLATRILNDNKELENTLDVYMNDYEPNFDWIDSFYAMKIKREKIKEMITANTSFFFKELINSIVIENNENGYNSKSRKVQIWEEKPSITQDNIPDGNELRTKLVYILRPTEHTKERKNRVIIYVSDRSEGFKVISYLQAKKRTKHGDISWDKSEYGIVENGKINVGTPLAGLSYRFVMGVLGNRGCLESFKRENENIPDILIVSYKVAQVGINLPTYNYVINYHIPSDPGSLEQRYGRIDRMNTHHMDLYNIYYLSNDPYARIYRYNLSEAFRQYILNIVSGNDLNNLLPVKNLLLCEEFSEALKNIQNTQLDVKDDIANLILLIVYRYRKYKKCKDYNLDFSDSVKKEVKTLHNFKFHVHSEQPYLISYTSLDSNYELQNTIKVQINDISTESYYVELMDNEGNQLYWNSKQLDDEFQFVEDISSEEGTSNQRWNKLQESEKISEIDNQITILRNYISNIEKTKTNIAYIHENLQNDIFSKPGCIIFKNKISSIVQLTDMVKEILNF